MPSSPGQKHNLLALVRIDQPSEWDMQKGGTLYVRKMVQSYISAGVIRQYSIRLRADQKTDQGQTADIVSAISWISTSKLDET